MSMKEITYHKIYLIFNQKKTLETKIPGTKTAQNFLWCDVTSEKSDLESQNGESWKGP